MTGRDTTVLGLEAAQARDAASTGGKGANLAEMVAAGLPVPPGFVVATSVYRRFVAEARLTELLPTVLADSDAVGPVALAAASARLRAAFEAAPVPAADAAAVVAAYRAMGGGRVAVRSSATAEDLPEASFAGQQETVLDVEGADALLAAVRRCWSSAWTARAIAYRCRHGVPHEQVAVAVVVQRMVPADVAGVLFTADPVTSVRHHVVVEATAGLGEALVAGRVSPQRWRLDARTAAVLEAPPGPQPPLLDAGRLAALADLGLAAARLFGCPQDVEWAMSGGRCSLLQSRPIASLFPLPDPLPSPEAGLHVYIPALLAAQGIATPLTPAGTAFFRALMGAYPVASAPGRRWRRGRPAPVERPSWAPVARGRLFFDVTVLVQRPRLRARLLERIAMKDPVGSAALREWLDRNADRLPKGPLPPALVLHVASVAAPVLVQALHALVAPERARTRALRRGEEALARLRDRAGTLRDVGERVEFVDREMAVPTLTLVLDEVAPVLTGLVALLAAQRLAARWLGARGDVEAVRRWLPHDPTVEMGLDLWRLAVRLTDRGEEPTPGAAGVEEFLRRYGHRAADQEIDVGAPRFREDPAYLVGLLRTYREQQGRDDVLRRFSDGVAEAQRTISELVAETRLVKGRARAALLHVLLDRGRALAGQREQPKFDLVRAIALARAVLRQVGDALAADGALATADDVFFLDPAEIRRALREGTGALLRERAQRNRREFARELTRRAIPLVLTSEGEAVYGPSSSPGGSDTLVGTPVSPGVHEGTVRVATSPVDTGLRPGEVLVAPTTDPGWTPLFLTAGALVMEVGGIVSHGALVAREYGIPAVTAVPGATSRLRSGQRVQVDGNAGTVRVLSGS